MIGRTVRYTDGRTVAAALIVADHGHGMLDLAVCRVAGTGTLKAVHWEYRAQVVPADTDLEEHLVPNTWAPPA